MWNIHGKENIMAFVISLAIVIFIGYRVLTSTDRKVDNRRCPPGKQIDYGAMNHDLAMGKRQSEVKDKYIRGGYDIPKK